MKVSDNSIINSYCEILNFKLEADNVYYSHNYNDNKILELYSHNVLISKRDLKNRVMLITSKKYSTNIEKHIKKLDEVVSNKYTIIFVADLYPFGELYNFRLLLEDIKNGGEDIAIKVDNLINFLDYFKIDKRLKDYKHAVILINKYNTNKRGV